MSQWNSKWERNIFWVFAAITGLATAITALSVVTYIIRSIT